MSSQGAYWEPFGLILGFFLAPFWCLFSIQIWVIFLMIFSCRFASKMVPFGLHLGVIFGAKMYKTNRLIFGCGFEVDFCNPRAPSEAKTIENAWRVVQNQRSTFSCPSASGVDFGSQNGAIMEARSTQNQPRNG